mgnify:CR=1 FL=1
MIYLLHGSDYESSYARLTQIILKFPKHIKIRLNLKTPDEKIYEALYGQNLTGDLELIILEDLLKKENNILKILSRQTPAKEVIFWEKQEISPRLIAKLPKIINVEHFKKSAPIYAFLDSLVPKSSKAQILVRIQQSPILWYLENRILLLILAKTGFDSKQSGQVAGKEIQNWQWQKIKDQSEKFDLVRLLAFYQGSLKVDYMIKTGKTRLDESTLTSILLLKYL